MGPPGPTSKKRQATIAFGSSSQSSSTRPSATPSVEPSIDLESGDENTNYDLPTPAKASQSFEPLPAKKTKKDNLYVVRLFTTGCETVLTLSTCFWTQMGRRNGVANSVQPITRLVVELVQFRIICSGMVS